ncbi:MAG TPA: TetR/AcrR family transcriptional regulator [Minicystis sp.]|nr:TetR/AcrR family transcriptional regulator [Minicystis sp.]
MSGNAPARASKKRPPRRPAKRTRRTSEAARAAILDAAERRLVEAGPAGIRLQDVAADVGVAHPTVLHHFGSREALVREVCERRFASIHDELVVAMASSAGGADEVGAMVESVAKAVRSNGHARCLFWLALEGQFDRRDDDGRLRRLGLAVQELRTRRRKGRPAPLDDTLGVLALATLALLAEAVIGPHILGDLGLGEGEKAGARFRAWLARLLADHLEHGPRP